MGYGKVDLFFVQFQPSRDSLRYSVHAYILPKRNAEEFLRTEYRQLTPVKEAVMGVSRASDKQLS